MIVPIKVGITQNHNKAFRLLAKLRSAFASSSPKDYRKIPVIINNFNRLEYLQQLLEWLEWAEMKNIFILDNNSTYSPLLAFYKKTSHTVFQLNANMGHMALWKTHTFMYFKNRPYVYTDPDVVPIENCPKDAVQYFQEILEKFPEVGKVGFGLKIDDIPDHYKKKNEVTQWESRFWIKEVEQDIFEAKIDTTFALYKANMIGDAGMVKALRTGGKYMARHLPWYIDLGKESEEEVYFKSHTTSVSSWYRLQRIN